MLEFVISYRFRRDEVIIFDDSVSYEEALKHVELAKASYLGESEPLFTQRPFDFECFYYQMGLFTVTCNGEPV